jgi:hypothetical protein
MSFCAERRGDVDPPSVADSLRECAMTSPRAWQTAVDADVVDDVEDEVVKLFFSGCLSSLASSRFFFSSPCIPDMSPGIC